MAFETCPQCGYNEQIANAKRPAGMSRYVNLATKEVVVMQSQEKTVENESAKYMLEKEFLLLPKATTPVPATQPPAPVK